MIYYFALCLALAIHGYFRRRKLGWDSVHAGWAAFVMAVLPFLCFVRPVDRRMT